MPVTICGLWQIRTVPDRRWIWQKLGPLDFVVANFRQEWRVATLPRGGRRGGIHGVRNGIARDLQQAFAREGIEIAFPHQVSAGGKAAVPIAMSLVRAAD